MAAESSTKPMESVPDPDEDDLDELDDVLDEFAATRIDTTQKTPAGATVSAKSSDENPNQASGAPSSTADSIAAATATINSLSPEDEFAKQLQAGMADMLKDLESSPEMQKEFEKLVQELGGAAAAASDQASATTAAAMFEGAKAGVAGKRATDTTSSPNVASRGGDAGKGATGDESFQDAIKRTMERMQESSSSATAAAASSSDTDDILAQMLKEMEKGGFGGSEGNDEDFSKMLMGMMEQLTNKEILYEPMKELDDKFPGWMDKNRDKVNKDDLKRYEEQQGLVREIVARFEQSGYSDSNVTDREYIVERMQRMQAAGSPPADLVGDMSAAQEALGDLDAGCPTQ